ncbi:LysM peptidoglycan-binding domain-containing protein [Arthrobacter sp. UYEF20]|uniref:LysM peptidoglycan-binding domain-containing protein n=1 Tax=Arthrobacter sp. UYEF20 TaxID=1756363 RepID=UPI00339A3367
MDSEESSPLRSAPRHFPAADAAMAVVILLLGFFLAGTGSSLVQRWRSSSARQQSLAFEDQLGIIANTTGLIVITWWVMSLTAAVAAALLERSGRTRAATAAGKFSPAFMRRLALAAVGFQLLAAPLATAATPPPGPDPRSFPPPALSAQWTPTPAAAKGLVLPRRMLDLAAPASQADTPSPAPATSTGTGTGPATSPAAPGPDVTPQWTPRAPAVEPGPLAARQLRTQDPAGSRAEVTVRSGDSLWSLAAAGLGPFASDVDIAREWPRLYQANRAIIGESPHLLRPGQVLRLPPGE